MSNELVVYTDYQVLAKSESVHEVLSENLGEGNIQQFDLDRVKIPPAGGTMWQVPGLGGETAEKEICGVIVHWTDKRLYWHEKFGDSKEVCAPDCASENCIVGVGTPGGDCSKCPFAQFGSQGAGQACKLIRLLFIVRPTDLLPIIVALPPTSAAVIKKFFTRLSSSCIPFHGVEIALSLERVKNTTGIQYSKVVISMKRMLDEDAKSKIREYRNQIKSLAKTVTVESDDYISK